MKPFFSIIIPVYCAENFLCKTLESIIAQTYPNWECILVDDGSTDTSGSICDKYSEEDSRFITYHKDNGGVSSARNYGLKHSTGEWVTFVDSDDYIYADYLEKMHSHICDEEVPLLFACGLNVSNGSVIANMVQFGNNCYDLYGSDDIEGVLLYGAVCGKCYCNKILRKFDLYFNENIQNCEDCLFLWKYLEHVSKIVTSNYNGYVYVLGENSNSLTSMTKDPLKFNESYQLVRNQFLILQKIYGFRINIYQRVFKWITDLQLSAIKILYNTKCPQRQIRLTILSRMNKVELYKYSKTRNIEDSIVKYSFIFLPSSIFDFLLRIIKLIMFK